MGAAEGGVMPISHAMIATEVSPERRGMAMGIGQNLGSNLLGSFLAPVLLIAFAEAFGWRSAFFLAGVPGIISALVIWFILDEPAAPPKTADDADRMSILDALKIRNIWICVSMGVLLVAFFVITWAFLPLYLSQTRGFDETTMSWIIGTLGISATIGSFAISGISDKIGRKPVMIAMPFIAVLLPLAALFFNGSALALAAIFFVGWGVVGIFPLYMATIPSESVDARHHATVLGLAMGSCEILGGVFGPPIAGSLNDAFGMDTFLWVMIGLAVAAGLIAMGLEETAPAKRRK
jgi:predicted MFS family arabinose efflux permease